MHRRRVPRPTWDSLGDSAHFDLCQSSGLKGDTVAGRSLLDPHVDGAVSSAEAARAASKRRAAQKRRRSMQLGRLAMDPAQLEAERLAREAEARRKRAEDVALEALRPVVPSPPPSVIAARRGARQKIESGGAFKPARAGLTEAGEAAGGPSFASFELAKPLVDATERVQTPAGQIGFGFALPVQAKAIPAALRGLSVCACAPPGTGKTAAYALPALQLLLRRSSGGRGRGAASAPATPSEAGESEAGTGGGNGPDDYARFGAQVLHDVLPANYIPGARGVSVARPSSSRGSVKMVGSRPCATRVLVITQLRELASQVHATLLQLAGLVKPALTSACIVDGGPKSKQEKELVARPEVVVCTPRRMAELAAPKKSRAAAAQLSTVQMVVLDEADRLLQQDMADDAQQLVRLCGTDRRRPQVLLFSPGPSAQVDAFVKQLEQEGSGSEKFARVVIEPPEGGGRRLLSQVEKEELFLDPRSHREPLLQVHAASLRASTIRSPARAQITGQYGQRPGQAAMRRADRAHLPSAAAVLARASDEHAATERLIATTHARVRGFAEDRASGYAADRSAIGHIDTGRIQGVLDDLGVAAATVTGEGTVTAQAAATAAAIAGTSRDGASLRQQLTLGSLTAGSEQQRAARAAAVDAMLQASSMRVARDGVATGCNARDAAVRADATEARCEGGWASSRTRAAAYSVKLHGSARDRYRDRRRGDQQQRQLEIEEEVLRQVHAKAYGLDL